MSDTVTGSAMVQNLSDLGHKKLAAILEQFAGQVESIAFVTQVGDLRSENVVRLFQAKAS